MRELIGVGASVTTEHSKSEGASAGAKIAPYATLEAWRGFASLWVVMFHTTHALTVRYPEVASARFYAFSEYGSLGVQLFFVISGYCIAAAACNALERRQGVAHFARARVRRIYPPFWFAWFLAAGFSVLAGFLAARRHLGPSYSVTHNVLHASFSYWVTNLSLTQVAAHHSSLISPTWTLSYEAGFYAIVAVFLLMPAFAARGAAHLLNGLHLLTATALLVLAFVPEYQFYPLDLWPQFGIGVLVYDLVRQPRQRRAWLWLLGCATLLLVYVVRFDVPAGPEHESSRLTFAAALIFGLLLLALRPIDERLSRLFPVRILASVGLFSYSLYLTHMLVIGVINQSVRSALLPARLNVAEFSVTVLVSVAAGRVFYQFCERPFVKPIRWTPPGSHQAPVAVGQSAE